MVGRLVSFWESPFSGAMLVLGRVPFFFKCLMFVPYEVYLILPRFVSLVIVTYHHHASYTETWNFWNGESVGCKSCIPGFHILEQHIVAHLYQIALQNGILNTSVWYLKKGCVFFLQEFHTNRRISYHCVFLKNMIAALSIIIRCGKV